MSLKICSCFTTNNESASSRHEQCVTLSASYEHLYFYITDIHQEKIVEEGGLDALLVLLRSSQNTTILRVTSGAIANLAMNGNPGF